MKTLLLTLTLLTLAACGDHEGRRCLTKEEAQIKCEAGIIAEGYLLPVARNICAPKYQYEGCY